MYTNMLGYGLGVSKRGKKKLRKAGAMALLAPLGPAGLIIAKRRAKKKAALRSKVAGMSAGQKKALKKSLIKKKLKKVGAFALLAPLGPAAGIAAAIAKRRKARRKVSASRSALNLVKVPGLSPAGMPTAFSPAPSTVTNKAYPPEPVYKAQRSAAMDPIMPDEDPDDAQAAEDTMDDGEEDSGEEEEAESKPGIFDWLFSMFKPRTAAGWSY
jgi:hypothetical protein